jgi:hypothetical protein
MEHKISPTGSIIPRWITKSYFNFGIELNHSELIIIMFMLGDDLIDQNRDLARQTLAELIDNTKFNEIIKSEVGDRLFSITSHEHFYGQMCYARTIDNILSYFKEILGEVILKKPQILKSKEAERLDFILNFNTIEELILAVVEKKVEQLFYGGINDIKAFFNDRLGIQLFKTDIDEKAFSLAVKNRNLIVHNRGIVNKNYIKDFPEFQPLEGESLSFEYGDLSSNNVLFNNFIALLDYEIASKFDLDVSENSAFNIW